MPIAVTNPSTPAPITPAVIEKPPYQGVTVDSKYTPIKTLLPYVEGQAWTVEYYSQVLGTSNAAASQQENRPAQYQQYHLIKKMELKVTRSLEPSQDTETNRFTVSGSAVIYPVLIPNKGDMFTADVGDGRIGLFTITELERKTILRDSCYETSYKLVSYLDDVKAADLKSKTIRVSHFVKEFLTRGQNPILSSDELESYVSIQELGYLALDEYLKDFWSREYGTLLIPGQAEPTYDHFLMSAFTRCFNSNQHPLLAKVELYNVEGSSSFEVDTVWGSLMSVTDAGLHRCMRKPVIISTATFRGYPARGNIYFSGIRKIVAPAGDLLGADPVWGRAVGNSPQNYARPDPSPTNAAALEALQMDPLQPLIPAIDNVSYMFSDAFYDNGSPLSTLETQVRLALSKQALNHEALLTLLQSRRYWEPLEQFYYTPVLLILVKLFIGDI